jgi:iron complex transport system ATP-binding protein
MVRTKRLKRHVVIELGRMSNSLSTTRTTLRVLEVSFSYGAREVLKDVTMSLRGGEFVGLMGPNGSGKTTLLKVINSVLKPKEGVVLVNELDVSRLTARDVAKLFGVVGQEYETSLGFTALDVVLMGRNPHLRRFKGETKRDYEVALEAMRLTNTLHLAERLFNELSGGEKQRVVIARALAQEPKILLLDEPTSHLDVNNQIEVLGLLRRLCRERGVLVIAVVHDFNLAAYYCDKVILMKNGEIFAMGAPSEVLTPSNIEAVFGVKVLVQKHPLTGLPFVIPMPRPRELAPSSMKRIHVVCGGGTGAPVIRALTEGGFKVTAGVLNVLDSDYEVAIELCEEVVCEAPFSPISQESHEKNLKLIESSDAVVLTDVPIGWGNLKNLEAVGEAVKMGKEVYLVETRAGLSAVSNRDYTGGEATRLLNDIYKRAVKAASIGELMKLLEGETGPRAQEG